MKPNPLVTAWSGPYGGVPPWDQAKAEHFPGALETALAEQRREIEAIAGNPEDPTFENTLEALERSGRMLDRVARVFAVVRQNISTPEIQALDREWQPRLAAAADAILLDPRLFARVRAVFDSLAESALDAEQKRLTDRVHDYFVRHGARLADAEKARLSDINQALAGLFSDFRSKVLADEDTWTVLGPEDLAGLPASAISAAKAAAEERGLDGAWVVVNTRSSVDPFLTFSTRRDLRERVWRKFKSRGDEGNENDTKATIADIVRLRVERARLLGYASHAHWRMADSMAGDPAVARAFLMDVWPAAVAQVAREVAEMQAIAAGDAPGLIVEPWDYLFYAEQVRKARYDLDHSQIEPYFELNNMVAAALWSAERRYDIRFGEITGTVPVFHPDVRVFTVTDSTSGAHLGLFYLDNFARAGKRSGAWASTYRVQHKLDGGESTIASNNNNFVKGSPGEPTLISLDDATTLFHEFGHALHSLLQDITYAGLSSTPRDFVEFPSQVNESWLLTRELLDTFARHHQTGAPMPQQLVDKIRESAKFNQGYATVEYLSAAILDMELHSRTDGRIDPAAFERDELARIGMPREIALRHRFPHFDHLFGSDSYSAGYYSYLWSDVMAADAWQAFEEAGPWDKALCQRMRRYILSDGNTSDRAEAYRRFRGRDPEVAALLESRGLPSATR